MSRRRDGRWVGVTLDRNRGGGEVFSRVRSKNVKNEQQKTRKGRNPIWHSLEQDRI